MKKNRNNIWLGLGFLLLSLLFLANCGGQLGVRPEKIAPVPPPIEPTQKTDTRAESFYYQQPSGTLVFTMMIYSSASMRQQVRNLINSADTIVASLLAEPHQYQDVVLTVATDSNPIESYSFLGRNFNKSNWKYLIRTFLQQSLIKIEANLATTSLRDNPFIRMAEHMRKLRSGQVIYEPQWNHYVYLRSRELRTVEYNDETLNNSIDSMKEEMKQGFNSPFRTSVSLVAYLDSESSCRPLESWIAPRLSLMIDSFRGWKSELCGFDKSSIQSLFSNFYRMNQQVVLAKVPVRDSIEVSVGDQGIPKEQTRWNESENSIYFVGSAAPQAGTPITVSYETIINP